MSKIECYKRSRNQCEKNYRIPMCRKQCENYVKNNVETHTIKKNIETLLNFMSTITILEYSQKRSKKETSFFSNVCFESMFGREVCRCRIWMVGGWSSFRSMC